MSEDLVILKPVSQALGVEVSGIDIAEALADPMEAPRWQKIHAAFAAHKVIFFRNQTLSSDQLVSFAARFGPIGHYPFANPIPENPDVVSVIKEPHQRTNFGGLWHTDTPYLGRPSAATVLYALDVPEVGGDTLWANMALALNCMPDEKRYQLEGREAVHSAAKHKTVLRGAPLREGSMEGRKEAEMDRLESTHPILRTHPVTGIDSLYISPAHTTRILGLDESVGTSLLESLFSHAIEDRFTCRFQWTVGTLAIWDNRCTLHYPLNDYHGARRAMHRISIEGEIPR